MRLLSHPILLAVAAVIAAAVPLVAQPTLAAPRGYSASAADVVADGAGVLDAESKARINAIAWRVWAGSRGEIAVATLPDLEGREVGDVALALGRQWGVGSRAAIGDRERNAGVIVLLVPSERSGDGRGHISIQVGQGAEGFITDGIAGDIRREATPLLQQRAYGPALALITGRLAERYAAEFQFAIDSGLTPPRERRATPKRRVPPIVFIIAIFVIMNVISAATRRGGRRGRGLIVVPFPIGRRGGGFGGGFGGGGFGGGGFGGFGGGGGFSGGGSSGSF